MSTVESNKMVKSSAEIVDELFRELQEKSVSSIDFGGFPLSEIQHKAVELRETNNTKDTEGSSTLGGVQEKQRESSANDSPSGSSDRTKLSRKKHKHKKKKKRSAESEKRHRHKHRKRKKSHDSDTKGKHKHKRKKSCSDYEWEPKEVSDTSEQHKKKLDCVSPDIKCKTLLSKEKGESSINEQSALEKRVQEDSVESQTESSITTSTLQSGSDEHSKLPSDNNSKLRNDENSINNALVSSTSDLSSVSELCISSKNSSLESSKSSARESVVVKTIESADTTTSEDFPGKKAEKLDSSGMQPCNIEPKINFATDDKLSGNSLCDLNLGKSNTVNSDKKGENDVKQKGKIVIKDLKSSLVFQQVVEEAKKIAENKENEKSLKEEDASSQDSNQDSGSSGKSSESADSEVGSPKTKSNQQDQHEGEDESKDILPKELTEQTENSAKQSKDHEDSEDPEANKKSKSQKSSSSKRKKRDRGSRSSRSSSKHRHRHHHHSSRKHSKSTHKYKKTKRTHSHSRSTSRCRSRTKSRSRSRTRSWTRSRSRSRGRSWSRSRDRYRSRSHSPRRKTKSHTREKIDKAKLLEIARKNAVMMINKGNLPPGVSLDNIKQDQLLAIKAGGKSVEELTDFCKQLALKEGNEHSSDDGNKKSSSDNEGTEPFIHHPFKLRDSQPNIVMNIRNAVQLPVRTPAEKAAEAAKLRIQFPVSSGSQHRKKELEWVPVVPEPEVVSQPAPSEPMNDKVFSEPEPQLVLPIDVSTIVSQRLKAVRKLQENPNDVEALNQMYQVQQQMQNWAQSKQLPGQFTGSTNARILTPEELAGPMHTQAWVKKDQFNRAAPIDGGMGMYLLRKMGWNPGEGLGKNKEGVTEPLVMDIKIDKKGLTSSDETLKKPMPLPVTKDLSGKHPVSALVELCCKKKWGAPEFTLIHDSGPDHRKNFLFKVRINNVDYQPTIASPNKKHAKAQAATVCLQSLGLIPRDFSNPI